MLLQRSFCPNVAGSPARGSSRALITGTTGKATSKIEATRLGLTYDAFVPQRYRNVQGGTFHQGRLLLKTSASAGEASPQDLHAELAALEAEQNEAVNKAELCAKTSRRLQDIIRLLDEMALQRMRSGNEEEARAVLVEKATVKEALASNAAKASANAMLAKKLAPLIASKRQQLPALPPKKSSLVWPPPPTFPSPSSSPPASSLASTVNPALAAEQAAAAAAMATAAANPSPSASPSAPAPSLVASTAPLPSPAAADGSFSATWPQPKWQQSLEEARARIRAEEASARESGRAARLSAEESITAAKARLERQAEKDLQAGLSRVRQVQLQSLNSIEEARERIREQDRQVLVLVQQIMARYRRGEYVPEDELEFAFQQLERRFTI